jgi:cytochrome c oxidase accessory protein FixG
VTNRITVPTTPANPANLLQPEGRVLSTLEADGTRRWLYPRLAQGRFWRWRRRVAWGLIALFAALPYIPINGQPAILLDIVQRRFTLLGKTFLATDTAILAVFLLAVLLGIFAVTALLGRVWCGWACPQTVYLEFLFRPIERIVGGRRGAGSRPAPVPAWRTVLAHVLSLAACVFLAHTFLAYFVGVAELRRWVTQSPLEHPIAFTVMLATTALMVFDFLYFREQTCIIACPYGRLQSVLLDRSSLIISYDAQRGEPRGKMRRSLPIAPAPRAGDCVDCALCVQVCPTGIDIREGLQIECVACAQCIDACDAVMDKLGRPRGLVRYTSQEALDGRRPRLLRVRVVIYCVVVAGLLGLLGTLLLRASPADVTLLRQPGLPFFVTPAGEVENIVLVRIVNRTQAPASYSIGIDGGAARLRVTDARIELAPGQTITEPVHVVAPRGAFDDGTLGVRLRVATADGKVIERPFRLQGPLGAVPATVPTGGRP